MKVYVTHDVTRQLFNIYIEEAPADDRGGRWFRTHECCQLIAYGAEPPVWAQLPEGVAASLAEALSPWAVTVASERHLNDAIAVRDRLLAIVERGLQ